MSESLKQLSDVLKQLSHGLKQLSDTKHHFQTSVLFVSVELFVRQVLGINFFGGTKLEPLFCEKGNSQQVLWLAFNDLTELYRRLIKMHLRTRIRLIVDFYCYLVVRRGIVLGAPRWGTHSHCLHLLSV